MLCPCLVAQSCPTLCDPTECNPPSSSVHRILQADILEWVAMPLFRASSRPRTWTHVSCVAGGLFMHWVSPFFMHWEALFFFLIINKMFLYFFWRELLDVSIKHSFKSSIQWQNMSSVYLLKVHDLTSAVLESDNRAWNKTEFPFAYRCYSEEGRQKANKQTR